MRECCVVQCSFIVETSMFTVDVGSGGPANSRNGMHGDAWRGTFDRCMPVHRDMPDFH